ncbi:MAG: hypothetical protein A2358_01570 [Candidatus Staskawiczbacteria bacterium RIFOXYB1_FULL_37_44]|uniref:Peptidoglycan binding-like domain-containing protein n=1 Tax=Candidatus Staskawiczbacteria bacterium RIFOXYB1_FULL_37_44 TaxID=1802223 RepID=A0A1G2IXQ8_9BACT|nr:MAG: hypothetical protein A2358_01570 [Candidatus Staskawiczbacteria bacterium RIFOXYB1_FULL_37_44]OGZ83395.1 MAG: hypothetical protein A2416_02305 [Candidatus Staskawiczbacteria bacterium RIFOXYC1_FULL_37_52]OGZ88250.1 MAG: hypothetical protein A2444_00495 [Candidatus Staskawiczbacteria bacterium RIFOXYC2_FULL_37_19]OGZ88798.1 MAG: hypothetical protein A2581_03245 [Candidatus Staskawiczbacteria bacterium RIFOXYD1_FULL_37_110]
MGEKINKITIFVAGVLLFFAAGNVKAANVGDAASFNVDKNFDIHGKTQISATLIKASSKLYFYAENQWWNSQSSEKQNTILANLDNLSVEFSNNIYPKLTSTFGQEWNPGIDGDSKITVLFESMNNEEGGYFREADEYEKIQVPISNEREMIYMSTAVALGPNAKIVLGHEFMHLITFNQKNRINKVEEDTWLNEARADYTSTILGYDDIYKGSNLQQRVIDFIENPTDSLIDWTGKKYDYASVNLFMHYLVDRYRINILSDSLKSKSVGIESINEALLESGSKDGFAQVFTNWAIALALNDCSLNLKYCYSNKNLANLKINPTLIFLPLTGSSSLSSTNVTKSWVGNWQKIIGGSGNLKLDFSGLSGNNFQVSYIVYDKNNNYSVNFLNFDADGIGEVNVKDFGTKYKSLIIIPSLQTEISGIDGMDIAYPYNFTVSISGDDSGANQALIQNLLDKIDSLKKQIADILAQRQGGGGSQNNSCSQLTRNLYLGSSGSDVSCLQTFLKNQGAGIYPEGLVTGNFGSLTKQAVIKFQEKYSADVLSPIGLTKGTGYVGVRTRTKINQILGVI